MPGSKDRTAPPIDALYKDQIDSPHTDSLTGLVNHGCFYATLEREVARAKRHGISFALGVVNVDSFRLYNKAHGRLEGDRILKEVGIVGVVDIYDALITDRPYRNGMSREKAFSILTEEANAGKIDKDVVSRLIAYCNDGSEVEASR